MKHLRRTVVYFLLAVAAVSAVSTLPAFAAQTETVTAADHCDCGEQCNLGKSACDEQGTCATVCGGFMAADVTITPPVPGARGHAVGLLAAAHTGMTRPPPLGPPRA